MKRKNQNEKKHPGEINMVEKDPLKAEIRFCMCFPDVYEIGMSHLGIQILYDMLNLREDIYCERVYSPWVDLDKIMREQDIPLFQPPGGHSKPQTPVSKRLQRTATSQASPASSPQPPASQSPPNARPPKAPIKGLFHTMKETAWLEMEVFL